MRRTQCRFMWWVGALLLAGCAVATPPSRLSQYVAPVVADESASPGLPVQRPLRTALVVLADRSAQEAAPGLPEEAQARLAEALRGQVNRGFPIAIERVVNLGEIPVGAPLPNWIDLAGQQGVDFVLVVILSSTEQEYPVSLFLGWTTHLQPGFRRDNWSLAEAAFLDGRTGRQLLRAAVRAKIRDGIWLEGREWRKSPDGHIQIDIEGYYAWVEQNPPNNTHLVSLNASVT